MIYHKSAIGAALWDWNLAAKHDRRFCEECITSAPTIDQMLHGRANFDWGPKVIPFYMI